MSLRLNMSHCDDRKSIHNADTHHFFSYFEELCYRPRNYIFSVLKNQLPTTGQNNIFFSYFEVKVTQK